jgi:hypothetical protein
MCRLSGLAQGWAAAAAMATEHCILHLLGASSRSGGYVVALAVSSGAFPWW